MAGQSEHLEQLNGLNVDIGKGNLSAALFSDVNDAEENRYSDTINEFGIAEIDNEGAAPTLQLPTALVLDPFPG